MYVCVCIYGGKNAYVYNISESIKKPVTLVVSALENCVAGSGE